MTRRRRKESRRPTNGLGGMLACSLALHLVFFFSAANLGAFRSPSPVTDQAIFVDVVNLPVHSPQAGSPAGTVKNGVTVPRKAMPIPRAARQTVPPVQKPSKVKPGKIPPKTQSGETAQEYEERLAALEQSAEAHRQEAALADLQHRVAARNAGGATAGMPGGSGHQAGSDYAAYLQSRLRESFSQTIAWQSKKPMVVVRLTLDPKGVLISYKIEKSSGDPIFEDAVSRAVQLARKNFQPPPGGKEFSFGFVFRPEGVDKK